MNKLLLTASALALLTGCAIEEADFPEAYGSAVCARYKDCDKADYESNYSDKAECVEDFADAADFILDAGDLLGQDYNPELGRQCVNSIRSESCENVMDGDVDCEIFGDAE